MFNIPAKVLTRFQKSVLKFQSILKNGRDRDLNESDTVSIITDILSDVFGYDKYLEVTSELAIRGTYCDLAIKVDNKFQFLIECKAIGIELKPNHLKQAIDYGANKGIPWVILTNGVQWGLYCIRFEQPISYDQVILFNFDQLNIKNNDDLSFLYVLSKEALSKNAREGYLDKALCLNKFIIGNMLYSDSVILAIRKEVKKFAESIKVKDEEVKELIQKEIIKREILDGEDAKIAQEKLLKFYKKQERLAKKKNNGVLG